MSFLPLSPAFFVPPGLTNAAKKGILFQYPRRGVAQLVARLLWEQEAASSSLATPIEEKATMNRLEMRFCRGFSVIRILSFD